MNDWDRKQNRPDEVHGIHPEEDPKDGPPIWMGGNGDNSNDNEALPSGENQEDWNDAAEEHTPED